MEPLLLIIANEGAVLLSMSAVADAFAVAGVFLIVVITAAVILVKVMNRKQQHEAKKRSEKGEGPPIT